MDQSEMATQKLEWIIRRQREAAQQWRHDVKVDLAFAVLYLCFVAGFILFALR